MLNFSVLGLWWRKTLTEAGSNSSVWFTIENRFQIETDEFTVFLRIAINLFLSLGEYSLSFLQINLYVMPMLRQ